MNKIHAIIGFGLIALVLPPGTRAQVTNVWQGTSSSTWSDTANWSLGTMPANTTDVLFAETANQTIDLGGVNRFGRTNTFHSSTPYTLSNGVLYQYANRMYQNGAGTIDFYNRSHFFGTAGGWAGTGTGTVNLHGAVSGPVDNAFAKEGAFTMRILGTNTFNGPYAFMGGVLEVLQAHDPTKTGGMGASGNDPKTLILGTDSPYPLGTKQWSPSETLTIQTLDATGRSVSNLLFSFNLATALRTAGDGDLSFASNTINNAASYSTLVISNPVTRIGVINGTALSIRKRGPGRLVIGDCDRLIYFVHEGDLFLNGTYSYASSTYMEVQAGARLGGTGNFTGPVRILSGGMLSPGEDGAGAMTFNKLDIKAGAILEWDIGNASNDTCVITNALTFGATATLRLTNDDSVLDPTDEFVLFTYPSSMTDPTNPTWTCEYVGNWTTTNGVVSVDPTGNRVVLTGVSRKAAGTLIAIQ